MAFCTNCGGKLDDTAAFCQTCGRPTKLEMRAPIPKETTKWPKTVAIIALIIVIFFVLLAILISVLSHTRLASPTEPVRSANINVVVGNDDWTGTKSYSIYIDNNLKKTDTIGALAIHENMLSVTWRGGTLHDAVIKVFCSGATQTRTLTVQDGGSTEMVFTI